MSRDAINPNPRASLPRRRAVVKVGSGVIAPAGSLEQETIDRLADEMSELRRAGLEIVVVTSGAVAAGFRMLGLERMPATIIQKQAAAAIGQQRVMQRWTAAFSRHGLHVAQILVTADDLQSRGRFINARHTADALLGAEIVPIVNENDTVSFDEIRLGDNDHLSALVASLVDAEVLILLTITDGVCEGGADGPLIPVVDDPHRALAHATGGPSETGVGGMQTKIRAAAIAAASGCRAVVANGRRPGVLAAIARGDDVGTTFPAQRSAVGARKRWIGYSARPLGAIRIDDGARDAVIGRGASVLPSGIVSVTGRFASGDPISIIDPGGNELARGIASYSADEVDRIKGLHSSRLEETLGYFYSEEVVHRNDMMLVRGAAGSQSPRQEAP